ncbi:MAG TPA: hypothetical protein VF167_00340 [Longimicrobiaceae bacterium]
MRQRIAALLIVAALPLAATPVAAQGILPFTLGGRMGLAIPVDDFAAHAETGYVTEVLLKASPLPFATLYGGWSFAEFGVDSESAIAGLDTKVRDSGFRAGGELSVPWQGSYPAFRLICRSVPSSTARRCAFGETAPTPLVLSRIEARGWRSGWARG